MTIGERPAGRLISLWFHAGVLAFALSLCGAEARGQLVISQLFGAAGQNASAANGDFVEIFNRSCVSVPLSQYSVQVATGITSGTWLVVALPNVALAPGKYFCIRLSTSTTGTPFTADVNGTAVGDILLSSGGKAAVVFGSAPLSASCPAQAAVIDLVIYSATEGVCTEGTRFFPSSGIASGRGYQRKLAGCQDTNVNLDDFESALTPATPRTSQTPLNPCSPPNVFGACNLQNGSCRAVESEAACTALAGTYVGDCVQCVFPEACCLPTSPVSCTLVTPAQCAQQGGINAGGQLSCPPTPACPALGRCCALNGTCTLEFAALCVAPRVFGGVGTSCAGTPCAGRCCGIDGSCNVVGPSLCVAPSSFGGIGTTCADPNGCIGACCSFSGQCSMQGPGNCLAPNIFNGVGVTCAQVQCSGRCCVAGGCSVTSPGQCTGAFTLGQTCDPIDVREFNGVNLLIPLGLPAPGGFGPVATNVQTVTGVVGTITDVNVSAIVQHSWAGDVKLTVSHLGTAVTIVDLIGHSTPDSGGCSTDNLDIVLDDEGAGGPIEVQCNGVAPAASSPPNYTPEHAPGIPFSPGGLSAFDGLDPNGEWTISVSDGFNLDSGTLLSWALEISHVGSVCPSTPGCISATTGEPCFGDMNGDGGVSGQDVLIFAQCVSAGGGGCPCGDLNHTGGATAADVSLFINACLMGVCGTP